MYGVLCDEGVMKGMKSDDAVLQPLLLSADAESVSLAPSAREPQPSTSRSTSDVGVEVQQPSCPQTGQASTSQQETHKCLVESLCMLCEERFCVTEEHKNTFLSHLLVAHKLVIGEPNLISDLARYVHYWRHRFSQLDDIRAVCSIIKTNSRDTDKGVSEDFYLLCDTLPEDRSVRERIQKARLVEVLAAQQREREDTTFSKGCLFCRRLFLGNRCEVLNHMVQDHGFNIGLPDNLVYVSELLDLLEHKFSKFQCFFCDKFFKDRNVLKDHMRKKQHRRLNPNNKEFDKFYLINYLEFGKNWRHLQGDVDDATAGADDDEDTDTDQDMASLTTGESDAESAGDSTSSVSGHVVCLFCKLNVPSARLAALLFHMKECHHFDLRQLVSEHGLTFYDRVKVVNYIRRQLHHHTCIYCELTCPSSQLLCQHMAREGHFALCWASEPWARPEYYFPTYEDDALLCCLDMLDTVVTGDELEGDDGGLVIAEDMPTLTASVLASNTHLLSQLKLGE